MEWCRRAFCWHTQVLTDNYRWWRWALVMSGRWMARVVTQNAWERRDFVCDTKMMSVIGESLTLPSTHIVLEEEASLGCLPQWPHSAMALTSSHPAQTPCAFSSPRVWAWADSSGEMEGGVAHGGSKHRAIPEWKVERRKKMQKYDIRVQKTTHFL